MHIEYFCLRYVQAFYFTSILLDVCSGDGHFRSQPRDWLCLGS